VSHTISPRHCVVRVKSVYATYPFTIATRHTLLREARSCPSWVASEMFTFEQFSAFAVTYHVCRPVLPIVEEVMKNLAGRSTQTVKLNPDSRLRQRFKA
jgi:hypothetical protein